MNDHYAVYLHERIDTNAVFYVGKGTSHRVRQKCNRNPHWTRIVAKAGGFRDHLVAKNLLESEALELERLLIAELRAKGVPLCNMTDGGDGISGYRFSDEAKKAMSERMKQKTPLMLGKTFSPEHIENMRKAKLGKKLKPEHAKKAADARRGKPLSEKTRQKISKALTGKPIAKEVVARKYKPVKCLSNGVVYESVTHAAKALGLETTNISRCCKGVFKQTGGYSFEYALTTV
jgi:group I intron endonuclease